jgi:ribosome-associated toxin RatA of RatAB toxin-antitoxin module
MGARERMADIMSESTKNSILIDATPDECFSVVLDFDRYQDWAADIKSTSVLRNDDDGRGGDVEYRVAAMGRSTTYVLRYSYGSNPLRMSWRLVTGDLMRRLDGEYEFVADADGGTIVHYWLSVDLQVPLPGFVKRRAEAKIVRTALDELKARIEAISVS